MNIYLASDHAGFELKEEIKTYLSERDFTVEDLGTGSAESVNWAEYGAKAAGKVSQDPEHSKGILVCGSGIGMSIVANKFKGVRAALCGDPYAAEMSRKHNNANVLTMGARVTDKEKALEIVEIWLNTDFEGGRHQQRLDYLEGIVEKENFK
jgi:RpiB/LacA/LacB family sugar-phosphate isomerase